MLLEQTTRLSKRPHSYDIGLIARFLSIRIDRIGKGVLFDMLILPLLRIPYIVQGTARGEALSNYVTIIICLAAMVSMLSKYANDKHLPRWFGWALFYLLSIVPLTSGYIPSASVIIKRIATILYQITTCWIIYKEIESGDSLWISALSKMMYLLVIINLYTILRYPEGMYHIGETQFDSSYRNWLFGYDNKHIEYFILSLMLSMLSSINSRSRSISTSTIVLYAICLYSTLAVVSATSTIALFIFGILVIVMNATKWDNILNICTYSIVYSLAITSLVMIVTGMVGMPEGVSRFVTNTLGKSVTFSERSTLWNNAIHHITKHPVFGNGPEDPATLLLKIGHPSGPHNEIINIVYEGGIIHLIAFIGLYIASILPLYRFRHTATSRAISVAIVSMLIAQSMRGCAPSIWMMIYLCAAYCDKLNPHRIDGNPYGKALLGGLYG